MFDCFTLHKNPKCFAHSGFCNFPTHENQNSPIFMQHLWIMENQIAAVFFSPFKLSMEQNWKSKIENQTFKNQKLKIENWKRKTENQKLEIKYLKIENWKSKIDNRKLKIKNWKFKVENRKLKIKNCTTRQNTKLGRGG